MQHQINANLTKNVRYHRDNVFQLLYNINAKDEMSNLVIIFNVIGKSQIVMIVFVYLI